MICEVTTYKHVKMMLSFLSDKSADGEVKKEYKKRFSSLEIHLQRQGGVLTHQHQIGIPTVSARIL